MILSMYVIYNKVSKDCESAPFCVKNHGLALQLFNRFLSNDKAQPAEYELCLLAEFDNENCIINSIEDMPRIKGINARSAYLEWLSTNTDIQEGSLIEEAEDKEASL